METGEVTIFRRSLILEILIVILKVIAVVAVMAFFFAQPETTDRFFRKLFRLVRATRNPADRR